MMRHIALGLALLASPLAAQERVLSIGGSVTEIIYALGQESRLVGRDTTSTEPPAARALPDVGYMRALSPEGVLSVNPELIVMEDGAGPAETVQTLQSAGVEIVTVPEGYTPEAVVEKLRTVARALGQEQAGAALAQKLEADLAQAVAQAQPQGARPRVLFILANSGGRLTGAGAGSSAEAIITLAGGQNAVAGFRGYKPLTDEAIAAAAPDVILVMGRTGGASLSDYRAHPALAQTKAARTGRIVQMQGLMLLGFGLQTPRAITELHRVLFPEGAQ